MAGDQRLEQALGFAGRKGKPLIELGERLLRREVRFEGERFGEIVNEINVC